MPCPGPILARRSSSARLGRGERRPAASNTQTKTDPTTNLLQFMSFPPQLPYYLSNACWSTVFRQLFALLKRVLQRIAQPNCRLMRSERNWTKRGSS